MTFLLLLFKVRVPALRQFGITPYLTHPSSVTFTSWSHQDFAYSIGMTEHKLAPRGTVSEGTLTLVSKSMSGIYAMAMFTWYMALATTKIFAYDNYFYYLDEEIFEAVLFLPSIAFLTYVIVFTMYQGRKADRIMVSENVKV